MKITEIDSSLYCTSIQMLLQLGITRGSENNILELKVTHNIYADGCSDISWESVYIHDDLLDDENLRDEVDEYVRKWAIINTKNFI